MRRVSAECDTYLDRVERDGFMTSENAFLADDLPTETLGATKYGVSLAAVARLSHQPSVATMPTKKFIQAFLSVRKPFSCQCLWGHSQRLQALKSENALTDAERLGPLGLEAVEVPSSALSMSRRVVSSSRRVVSSSRGGLTL